MKKAPGRPGALRAVRSGALLFMQKVKTALIFLGRDPEDPERLLQGAVHILHHIVDQLDTGDCCGQFGSPLCISFYLFTHRSLSLRGFDLPSDRTFFCSCSLPCFLQYSTFRHKNQGTSRKTPRPVHLKRLTHEPCAPPMVQVLPIPFILFINCTCFYYDFVL